MEILETYIYILLYVYVLLYVCIYIYMSYSLIIPVIYLLFLFFLRLNTAKSGFSLMLMIDAKHSSCDRIVFQAFERVVIVAMHSVMILF